MKLWLPYRLYQVFPLLCVLLGFLAIALLRNPLGVIIASCTYIYAYRIMWLRLPCDEEEEERS